MRVLTMLRLWHLRTLACVCARLGEVNESVIIIIITLLLPFIIVSITLLYCNTNYRIARDLTGYLLSTYLGPRETHLYDGIKKGFKRSHITGDRLYTCTQGTWTGLAI